LVLCTSFGGCLRVFGLSPKGLSPKDLRLHAGAYHQTARAG